MVPTSLHLHHSMHSMLWRKERDPVSEPLNSCNQGNRRARVARSSQRTREDFPRIVMQQEMQEHAIHDIAHSYKLFLNSL